MDDAKRCGGRCGEIKPLDDFHRDARRSGGRRGECKACRTGDPAKHRERVARYDAKVRATVFDHYGWACACCGSTDRPTIDHVNGGGKEHREQVPGGSPVYRWLVKNGFPDGFQTLCDSCNKSKGDRGSCSLAHDRLVA